MKMNYIMFCPLTLSSEIDGLKKEGNPQPWVIQKPPGISPWADQANLSRPDGKTTAAIHAAGEVGMGAPTSGRLRLSNGLLTPIPSCSMAEATTTPNTRRVRPPMTGWSRMGDSGMTFNP